MDTLDDLLKPALLRALTQALHELERARLHLGAADRSAEARLCATRLAPDMLCLAHQVQVLADGVRGALAHLTGDPGHPSAGRVFNRGEAQLPPPADTLAALCAPLQATRDALAAVPPGGLARPAAPVRVARPGDVRLYGTDDFLWGVVLTNTLFHASLVHALLRHSGVALGKDDFLGESPWRGP
jgi:uncharacterized protein